MKITLYSLCLTAQMAVAHLPPNRGSLVPAPTRQDRADVQSATFSQLIDHNDTRLGTFSQRYWWDTQYWNGPGSPVVLFNPGEEDASGFTGYTTANTIVGLVAQRIGAATIVLEHRYWGGSSPFSKLTTANLQYLTLENNIQDLVNFAQHVRLPFATEYSSNSDAVPWVLVGGSYSGALTAWTNSVAPGTFWASLASSAPVETISDYWQYFVPVQEGMPQNCSKDVSLVIDYVDNILENGTSQQVQALKAKFGLGNIAHNDDFAAALANGPWLWQSNSFYSHSPVYDWCDYIENAVGAPQVPGANGVGLSKALDGYAKWMVNVQKPGYCASYGYFSGEQNTDCFETYNASNPMFTDTSVGNAVNRQWMWMLCNQPFGYWQDGAPSGRPSLVSRLLTPQYWTRQCGLYFPRGPQGQTYGIARGATEDEVNAFTGGWDITNPERLIYTNGQYDPWRSSGVSSEFRPGGPLQSTAQVPVNLIPKGVHCYDLIANNGDVNAATNAIQNAEVEQIANWVSEFGQQ